MLFACYYSFMYPSMIMFSTYLVTLGYDASLVAVMMSVSGLVSLAVRPVLAAVIDQGRCRMITAVLVLSMAAGTAVFFFTPGRTLFHAAAYAVLVSAGSVCFMDVNDSWVLKLVKETGQVDYGRTRAFGSAAFAVTGLIYGYALSRLGIWIAPICIFALLLLLFITTRMLPDPSAVPQEKAGSNGFRGFLDVIRKRKVAAFVLCYALANATFNFTDNYIPVLILEKGGTSAVTGLNDFIMATIEFLMLRRFTEIADRIGTDRIVWLGMLGFCAKAVLVALMPSPGWIIAACLTQVISFCFMIPSRMRFIEKNVEQDEIASAMSLTSFAGSLFSTFVSNPVASQVIPRIGTANTMILYGLLAAFAAVCFALYLRYTEGNKVQNI